MSSKALTPAQLAEKWQVKTDTVQSLIHSGQLRAFNVGTLGAKKPRWRISPDAIVEFENLRRAGPRPTTQRKPRRQSQPSDFVEYF